MAWGFRKTITIDHTQVSGGSDLTDYPLLFSVTDTDLKTTGNGGSVTDSNGYDIVFSSDSLGNSLLVHEIESYTANTGELVFWVKIPTLSASLDTVIYLLYGDGSITTSQEDKASLWSDYAAVYHLKESGTGAAGEYLNSTGTGNDGQGGSGTASKVPIKVTSKIDQGQSFDGGDVINVGKNATLDNAATLSIQAWVKETELTNNRFIFANHVAGAGGFALYRLTSPNDIAFYLNDATQTKQIVTTTPISVGSYYHLVATFDGATSTMIVYINGVAVGSTVGIAGTPSTIGTSTADLGIGDHTITPSGWNGEIDEARLTTVLFTPDWIATDYTNQNTPNTFYSVGIQTAIVPAARSVATGRIAATSRLAATNRIQATNRSSI